MTTSGEEEESLRPAGFGFLMANARIVIPEDSKGSVTGGDFLSNLPGQEWNNITRLVVLIRTVGGQQTSYRQTSDLTAGPWRVRGDDSQQVPKVE